MNRVIVEDAGEIREFEAKIIERLSEVKILLNDECLTLFRRLQAKPSFPAELAKELGMNEQKVYYYIKNLRNSGLIVLERTQEKQGAVARYYRAAFNAFAVVPDKKAASARKILKGMTSKSEASDFLGEFMHNGIFSGKIVVGSPDAHGTYKARARDGHLAAELAVFIGANCNGFELPIVFLDTMVKDLREENSNLIIVGGPLTNKLAEQANEKLPIKFVPFGGNWVIKSSLSGKEYTEDTTGVIQKVPHPYFKGKWLLLVAGKRNSGTISAIIALAKKTSQAVQPNSFEKNSFCRIVEGTDLDGDGFIDEVEFRE